MRFRNFVFILLCLLICLKSFSQNVGIGTLTPDVSAMLDITSNDKGALLPRLLKANRPVNPAQGLIIYQMDCIPGFYYYDGGQWSRLQDATFDLKFNSFGPDTTVTFNHTGASQSWVVPSGVQWVKVDCLGAEGATGVIHVPNVLIHFGPGGKGGRSIGYLKVTPSETLQINVGGFVASPTNGTNGQVIAGGWNGGGDAILEISGTTITVPGAGGGASDVRQGGIGLAHRKIIAGGGGGGGNDAGITGGFGGGLTGGGGQCAIPASCAMGATQTSGNALSQGGSANIPFRGAGGGGYYGGHFSPVNNGAGSGGSGYIDSQIRESSMLSNIHSGHGIVSLTYNRNTMLDTLTSFPYPLAPSVIADAINLGNYGNNAVLYSTNDSIKGKNQEFAFNPITNRVGIGTNTPNAKLEVKGTGGLKISSSNPGTGFNDWIAASAGGLSGDRVIMGILDGKATLGAHNSTLNGWADLVINPSGKIIMPSLGQTGKRFVTINSDNVLSDTAFYTFNNGVSIDGTSAQLGGNLSQATTIANNANDFTINAAFEGAGGAFNQYTPAGTGPFTTNTGQTFNFPYNYTLTGIIYKCGFPVSNGSYQIFLGQTISGTPIASGTLTGAGGQDIFIPLNNLNLASNTTYTIWFVNAFPHGYVNGTWPFGTTLGLGGVPIAYDLYLKFIGLPSTPTHAAFKIEGATSKVGIGTPTNLPMTGALNVNAQNTSTSGTADWIAANLGGKNGDRIVMGLLNGEPSIGAHNAGLTMWDTLNILPGGHLKLGSLAGSGDQYLKVNNQGIVSAQSINTANGTATGFLSSADWNSFNNKQNTLGNANGTTNGILTASDWTTFNSKQNTLGNANGSSNGILTATDWNTFNNKQNALTNANGSTSGILTALDWNTFNNKQNLLANANSSTNGILTATDWNAFNNKQNALANANGSTNGILTSSDWNTFNNKFDLPTLTDGSIIYSNGSGLAQTNNQLHYNSAFQRVGIGTGSPFAKLDVQGEKGLAVNSTNNGTGTIDWIAINAGGTSGDRVVNGVLNGSATIGAHNQLLNAWDTLAINPGAVGTSIVLGGDKTNTTPTIYTPSSGAPSPVSVNGSIRQSFYFETVNIATGGMQTISWTHNLGYGPIVMMSTDQNGGGANMVNVTYTTYNNNANETIFLLKNNGAGTATGTFRWIVVW